MNEIIEKNGKSYIIDGGLLFEIVDVVPEGFEPWNVKRCPGYVPLCKLKSVQPLDGCCEVDTDNLKVISFNNVNITNKFIDIID